MLHQTVTRATAIFLSLYPGGSNTAGLGGFGGPYRLDSGNEVFQVPDWEKEAVPFEVSEAARAMAKKAWKER